MMNKGFLYRVETLFEEDRGTIYDRYRDLVPLTLTKVLSGDLFVSQAGDFKSPVEAEHHFQALMPLFKWSPFKDPPFNLSFFLICRYRPNAYKFFFEMISRWLVPGKRLNVLLIYAVDFRMPELGDTVYTLCEVMVRVESREDVQELKHNLPLIETELKLGVHSAYYARKILEVKGLKADEKTAMIQEYIAYVLKRAPRLFDIDIFVEMQHVMIKCRDDFKAVRESKHMGRIISVQYLFRRTLVSAVEALPGRRHVRLKLMNAHLHLPQGVRTVLGIIVGINFLKNNEVFEESHILKAIKQYVPLVIAVPGSFFHIVHGSDTICTLYLEVEKSDGSSFTGQEIKKLRQKLPIDLKNRIEHLVYPIFMPCNEEEIMRNILSLSNQLKYVRDIPQVVLTFDEQTDRHLVFMVILLRVLKGDDKPIQQLFFSQDTPLEYIHDRVKRVGYIRKRYPKEATVFKVKLRKEIFLRNDHTIDLCQARQVVVSELSRLLGDIRDFNGGMISKQNELLNTVRSMLPLESGQHESLLQNLFYSITPVVMRSVLDPILLKKLFSMLVEVVEEGAQSHVGYQLKTREEGDYLLLIIVSEELFIKEQLGRAVSGLLISPNSLITTAVTVNDLSYVGYIYHCAEVGTRRVFLNIVEEALLNRSLLV